MRMVDVFQQKASLQFKEKASTLLRLDQISLDKRAKERHYRINQS